MGSGQSASPCYNQTTYIAPLRLRLTCRPTQYNRLFVSSVFIKSNAPLALKLVKKIRSRPRTRALGRFRICPLARSVSNSKALLCSRGSGGARQSVLFFPVLLCFILVRRIPAKHGSLAFFASADSLSSQCF